VIYVCLQSDVMISYSRRAVMDAEEMRWFSCVILFWL